jgi:hypothetical protein
VWAPAHHLRLRVVAAAVWWLAGSADHLDVVGGEELAAAVGEFEADPRAELGVALPEDEAAHPAGDLAAGDDLDEGATPRRVEGRLGGGDAPIPSKGLAADAALLGETGAQVLGGVDDRAAAPLALAAAIEVAAWAVGAALADLREAVGGRIEDKGPVVRIAVAQVEGAGLDD